MDKTTVSGLSLRVFEFDTPHSHERVVCFPTNYIDPEGFKGPLAIQMLDIDDNGEVAGYYAVMTKNIDPYTGLQDQSDTRAFIDTNNGKHWGVTGFIERFGLAKDTGIRRHCGYCTYPLYEFDLSKFYAE